MKKTFNNIILLIITISLFFIGSIKINADTIYNETECRNNNKGYFTRYYTNTNGNEITKIYFVPIQSGNYSWSTKTGGGSWVTGKDNLKGKQGFILDLSKDTTIQGRIKFSNGVICETPQFSSNQSTYEITKISLDSGEKNIIVEGYALIITKNNSRIHNVNPTIKLMINNAEDIYLDKSKYTVPSKSNNEFLSRCSVTADGKAYRCPKDAITLKVLEDTATKYIGENTTKIDLRSDFSYTRYYAYSWSDVSEYEELSRKLFLTKDQCKNNNSPGGNLEFYQLFNLKEYNYTNDDKTTNTLGNIGSNLYVRSNVNGTWSCKDDGDTRATTSDVIKYYVGKGNKLYINSNFKFVIPIDKLAKSLSTTVSDKAKPKLKFVLNVYSKGGEQTFYNQKLSNTNSINAYITKIGIMGSNIDSSSISEDSEIRFSISNSNNIIKFLKTSSMRTRYLKKVASNPDKYAFDIYKRGDDAFYFANTYDTVDKIAVDDWTGNRKYYYEVKGITNGEDFGYYPINMYWLNVHYYASNSNRPVAIRDCKGTSVDCVSPCRGDNCSTQYSNPHLYALGTWISPQNETTFDINCKTDFTLFNGACCSNSNLINNYTLDEKTCCNPNNKVKNFNNDPDTIECCPSANIRRVKVDNSNNEIKLCENKCQAIICPSGSQKDIKGKCCKTGSISSSTGECSTEDEFEVDDTTGTVCKISEMNSSCKCKTFKEEYSCAPDKSSTRITRSREYKVELMSGSTTTCSEWYEVTFNKKVTVLQGGHFNYPVGLKVIRECRGGGVTNKNLPSYNNDITINKSAEANIILKDITVNATQIDPTLLEHEKANDDKKEYTVNANTEEARASGNIVRQEVNYQIEYKHNYYLNVFTGKIRAAALGISDGYLPSGKYVYTLLNAPVGEYNNDVIINIHGNLITINCSYEIEESIVKKYTFRQIDTDKVFARSKRGVNWQTETADAIITKIQNSTEEIFEKNRAMYEITLNSDSIREIKEYVDTNGYYNTQLTDDGNSRFIHEIFKSNININKSDNILKDIIE